jgi:tetratricopeptide (TPR) repeat protein
MKKKAASKPNSARSATAARSGKAAKPKAARLASAPKPAAKQAAKPAVKGGSGAAKSAAGKGGKAAQSAQSAESAAGKAGSAKAGSGKPPALARGKAPGAAAGKEGKAATPAFAPAPAPAAAQVRSARLEPVHPEPSLKVAETIPADDEAGLRNVMNSLASIFGGRDVMSDAELDALLDSKMASGEIPPSAALDPLDEAQSLIYEAWNSEGSQRVRLARRALETCPDCADAYVILAEEDARDRKQALEYFAKGVEAGERALAPGTLEKDAGNFWGIMETRPYMRARLGLAECLWDLGRRDEALGHLRELLRLNPSDNQGVRYILVQCLLETGADEELGELLGRYRDDRSPQMRYSHALWMFRHEGRGRKTDALLQAALDANPHVPDFLLSRRKPPKDAPAAAEAGGEEEAAAYAMGAGESWRKTLGALDWLADHTRNS